MTTAGTAEPSRRVVIQSSSKTADAPNIGRLVKESSLFGVVDSAGSRQDGEGHTFLRPLFGQVARFAYGCVMMEVWVYDTDSGRLNRCAWWVDCDFVTSHDCSEHKAECKHACCLEKLIDEDCPDYVEAEPLAAGVGLAGTLWSEVKEFHASLLHEGHRQMDNSHSNRPSLLGGRRMSTKQNSLSSLNLSNHGNRSYRSFRNLDISLGSHASGGRRRSGSGRRTSLIMATKQKRGSGKSNIDVDDFNDEGEQEKEVVVSRRIHWRNVEHLAGDPDQPYDERLQLLMQAGIGWAGAVTFAMAGHEGIVIYSTTKDAQLDRLKQPSNELYLRRSTDLIGAAFAIQGPLEIVSKHYDGGDITQIGDSTDTVTERDELEAQKELEEAGRPKGFWSEAKSYVLQMLHKYQGAAVKAPPSMIWEEALLTTVAAFFTVLMVASLSHHLPAEQGLVMGSFGAFTTLLFGLTAAPASQPRNAFWGQLISGIIAMSVSFLPWPVYVRQSLATALAIGTMVKMGITHPPAGGAAIILANGEWNWITLPFMLVGVCIALCSATFFNNLSQKRQYPTSWGLQPLVDILTMKMDSGNDNDYEVPPPVPSHKLSLARTVEKYSNEDLDRCGVDLDSDGEGKKSEESTGSTTDYSAEIEV